MIDVSALAAEFGAYYQDHGQDESNLKVLLFEKGVTFGQATMMPWKSDTYENALVTHGRIVQPFKTDWSPIDTGAALPYKITKRRLKVDIERTPDLATLAKWTGFLKTNKLSKEDHPFVAWYIDTLLRPQIIEDVELNEAYAGVYAAPAAGATPGAVGTAIDGLGKVIADAITDGYITPITTGALSATDSVFVEQIEDMVDLIADKYRKQPMTMYMSESNATRYEKGYADLYDLVPGYKGDGKEDYESSTVRHNRNIKIMGLPSMAGSDRVFCTKAGNIIGLTDDDEENMGNFQVKELAPRKISIWTDFELAIGFDDPRLVFCNEQV